MIHLDQALARMREYERMKIAAEGNLESEDGCCSNLQTAPSSKLEGKFVAYFRVLSAILALIFECKCFGIYCT